MPRMVFQRADIPDDNCRIKTGQYTGDGTVSQAVTGVGFAPKYLMVFSVETAGGWSQRTRLWDLLGANNCEDTNSQYVADHIISLDADGFTVDDGGADGAPNALAHLYHYVAFG